MIRLKTLAIATACLIAASLSPAPTLASNAAQSPIHARRVLLISIDGLHQSDLARWIAHNPDSSLARLSHTGLTYAAARTTTPSDSFPGLLAMVTGGTPRTTGVYYDDSYDRTLYAPGSHCSGQPGIEAVYDESIDNDMTRLFSGGINPAYLPMEKRAGGQCAPVFPHRFVKDNTIFEVIHSAGLRTAWSDKHPAYDLVNGPSGRGVDDLYTPEVNSLIANGGVANGVDLAATLAHCDGTNSLPVAKVSDYTTCIPSIEAYDDVKVQAIVNQIDGLTADGSAHVGVPAIFGMNFQEVSVGQKLPVGGYLNAAGTPSANLQDALAHTDQSIARMVAELDARGLLDSTLIIVSAKHGQSPIDPARLQMESGGRGDTSVQDPAGYIGAIDPTVDSPSSFTNPNSGTTLSTSGHFQTDDVGLLWLQNQSRANVGAVVATLEHHAGAIHASQMPANTVLPGNIVANAELAAMFGNPGAGDPVAQARAPNVLIQPDAGVIYSGSTKKIAEHGGGTLDDTRVALLVSLPSMTARRIVEPVATTQIAPTILHVLGFDPQSLRAVRIEGTKTLPGL